MQEKEYPKLLLENIMTVLQRVLGRTKTALLVVNSAFDICWHSDSFSRLFPGSALFPNGKCYSTFDREHPCERCLFRIRAYTSDLAEHRQVVLGKQGKERRFRIISIPQYGNDHSVEFMFEFVQEITPQHEAIAKYAKLYKFHKKIIVNAPVAIFTLNRKGVITTTNPAHLKIAGNAPRKRVLGFDWLNSRSVKRSGLYEYLESGLSGKPFEVADVPYTGNITGRNLYMTLRGVPLKAKDGTVESLLCILEDTTEKALYMNELLRLKDYNEHIIESITDGVAVIDSDFRLQTINKAMAKMLSLEPKHILKSNIQELFVSIGARACLADVHHVFSSGVSTSGKNTKVASKGKTILLDYKIMPLFNEQGQHYGVIIIFNDVTEKEKMELRFQHLFEKANDGILVTDINLNVIAANRRALAIFHIKSAAGRNLVEFFEGENADLLKSQVALLLADREPQPYEVASGNGLNWIPLEINMSLIKEHGDLIGIQFIVRDIAQRVKLEEKLIYATKMSALGEMAAGLAHEINNPIATISASSEEVIDLMKELGSYIESPLKSQLERLHLYIQEQCYRCKKISDDLLDYARVKRPLTHEVDANQIVIKIVNLAGLTDRDNKNRIRLNLHPNLPVVKSNASHMQQVFLNLLNNALDATEQSGTVTITTKHSSSRVLIIFEDTGIGIPQENLARLFDPFFTTKPSGKGTGLGLAISYRIVQRLKGSIKASSKKGEGSIFTVSFPIQQAD